MITILQQGPCHKSRERRLDKTANTPAIPLGWTVGG